MQQLLLVGDINLMNVSDSSQPFSLVGDTLRAADVLYANLECSLYVPAFGRSVEHEGFFADPKIGGEALKLAGVSAVGIANNVNYGEAPIRASIDALDQLEIPHTGAGVNIGAARVPAVVSCGGVTYGFLQRSSVYWGKNHEAGESATGIAVIAGHTAYEVPMFKKSLVNRPGVPPRVVTWADEDDTADFADDIKKLRGQVDVVVASVHWGLADEVLTYMTQIAHIAIDAGADVVIGHGPHMPLPVEFYHGKPVFYGLGSFSFHTGHDGIQHGDWIGLMAELSVDAGRVAGSSLRFVRHSASNQTVLRSAADEPADLKRLAERSGALGARLSADGDVVSVAPTS